MALSLLCAARAESGDNSTLSAAPPPPSPPLFPLSGLTSCATEECRLHSAVLALASVLALSGALNLALAAYLVYKGRMCRSWCATPRPLAPRMHADAPPRSGKCRSHYAARQSPCPQRCMRCRRAWDVRFRWSWHQCVWVHVAEPGPVLARPSVLVFGFPVAGAASAHLTAVVSAPDEQAPAPTRAAPPPAADERAAAAGADVESGALDFYGQETSHSTRDYFTPGETVTFNPFFRAA